MATLKIKRDKGIQDALRAYGVLVDDKKLGAVANGAEAVFTLPAGEHRVRLGIDWCGSNEVTVALADGVVTTLECGGSGNPLNAFFRRNHYLWLREAGIHAPPGMPTPIRGVPVLTLAILAVLVAVFVCEQAFGIGPTTGLLAPSIPTLLALGALQHSLVFSQGEWYRLLSATLLHADLFHILMNGVALYMVGAVLENFVGRAWYLALYVLGAVGGSLMSLAINPDTLVSVGASGAIMGLFAAAFVCSFHLPPDRPRSALQKNLLQVLIPSLLPLASMGSGHRVDIGAHLGGALTGAAMGFVLLKTWAGASPVPRFKPVAAAVALLGLAGAGYGYAPLSRDYSSFALMTQLIPGDKLPKTDDEAKSRSAELVVSYPHDPRARFFRALALLDGRDLAGGERELRAALAEKQILQADFKPDFPVHMQAVLALVLLNEGRTADAKTEAAALCRADDGDAIRQNLVGAHLCD